MAPDHIQTDVIDLEKPITTVSPRDHIQREIRGVIRKGVNQSNHIVKLHNREKPNGGVIQVCDGG